MNAANYREILEDNLSQSERELQRGRWFIWQQDNDPKRTVKAAQNWLKDNKVNTLQWSSQSPDFSPLDNLLLCLKRAVNNLTELEQFCKEEWSEIAVSRCANLTETYPHTLSAGIEANLCKVCGSRRTAEQAQMSPAGARATRPSLNHADLK